MVQALPRLGVAERMACRLGGRARSRVRYPRHPSSVGAGELRGAVRRLARQPRRDGDRRLTARLQRPGHRVHATRVWRIGQREGVSLPRPRPRRRRQRPGAGLPPLALTPNQGWPNACLFDRTEAGQIVKILIGPDEHTRARLAIRVERHLGAGKVIATVAWVRRPRGAPEDLRSDHGPAGIAPAWLAAAAKETRTVDSAPGHPWQHGYAESVIGTLRDAGLNEAVFRSVEDARVVIES